MSRTMTTLLAVLLTYGLNVFAQTSDATIVRTEHAQRGVVILALGSVGGHSLFEAHEEEELGDKRDDTPFHDPLIETQMEIATTAANHSQVVILVSDSRSKTEVIERCNRFETLCKYIDNGLIRIEVVSHEGPWIRDYGPMFGFTDAGKGVVFDARYYDIRAEAKKRAELGAVHHRRVQLAGQLWQERRREELLETLIKEFQAKSLEGALEETEESPLFDGEETPASEPDDSEMTESDAEPEIETETHTQPEVPASTPTVARRAPVRRSTEAELTAAVAHAVLGGNESSRVRIEKSATERELEFYDHLADAYERADTGRTTDDEAPYSVALSIMKSTDFDVVRPEINLDGGNLLRDDEGYCFTTRALLARNRGKEAEVTRFLTGTYRCKDVRYLEALPGPVIEHVDMFLLPGAGKRVFLASYDPADPLIAKHWGEMRPVARRLAEEAAVAMKRNARELARLGYTVIHVPSPLPRLHEGDVYYPTVLNALVQRSDSTGNPNLIVPKYEGYQDDIQQHARALIEREYGTQVTVAAVESTVAATRQGAVHCLTVVAPAELTLFSDDIRRADEDRVKIASTAALAAHASDYAQIEGVWRIADSIPGDKRRVVFRNQRLEMMSGEETELSFGYKVASREGQKWQLRLDDDEETWDVSVDWLDPKHVRMTFDEDMVLTLQRD